MRYAIVSDIHANLEALSAVLQATEQFGADQIICLGDIVGYFTNPNECIELVREHAVACVRGNHDSVAAGLIEPVDFSPTARRAIDWTKRVLTATNRRYLADLPLFQTVDTAFAIVHATLYPQPDEVTRIRDEADARPNLEMLSSGAVGQRICFFGHTHHRTAYSLSDTAVTRLDDDELHLDGSSAYLINPGSVGQSRDGDPRASFLIHDSQHRTVQFHRIDYDHRKAKAKGVAQGLIGRPHVVMRALRWLAAS